MQIGVWFRSLGGWASSPCHFALLEITMPSQARYRTDWRRHRCTRGWLACAHFIFPGRGCVQNNANICKHERKVANKKSVTQVILRGLEFEWSTVSERAHVVGTAFFSSQVKWEKKMMTCRREGNATSHTAHLPQQRSKNRFFITSLSTCLMLCKLERGTRKVGEQERNRRKKKGERARKKTWGGVW